MNILLTVIGRLGLVDGFFDYLSELKVSNNLCIGAERAPPDKVDFILGCSFEREIDAQGEIVTSFGVWHR